MLCGINIELAGGPARQRTSVGPGGYLSKKSETALVVVVAIILGVLIWIWLWLDFSAVPLH